MPTKVFLEQVNPPHMLRPSVAYLTVIGPLKGNKIVIIKTEAVDVFLPLSTKSNVI